MDIFNGVIWLVSFVLFLIVELVTVSLVSIWFAGGALVAFIVNLLGYGIWIQVGAFFVVSTLLLAITRPLASKFINRGIVKTNIDELVGKKVKVVEKVDNIENTGKVVLNGVEWTTRSESDDIAFEVGTLVVVKEVKGVKLIVAKQ